MVHTLTRGLKLDIFSHKRVVSEQMELAQWWQHNIRNKTQKYEEFPL